MHENKPDRDMAECLPELPLAMAYVPLQRWGRTYDADMAFSRGTLFPELDKPFIGEVTDDE